MKQLLFALMALCVASCSSTHIWVTKSNPDINKDSVYVYENDTVKITYDFWQPRTQMKFSIYNKLSIPLFIDWKNSAFIINDNTHAYWKDKTTMNEYSSSVTYKGVSSGHSSGSAIHEDRISFIPAHAKIVKTTKDFLINTKPLHTHIRNYIAYSINEDFQTENFVDCEFEIIDVKKISYFTSAEFSKYKDARTFYISR